jgi:hypothetical protein
MGDRLRDTAAPWGCGRPPLAATPRLRYLARLLLDIVSRADVPTAAHTNPSST